MSRIKLYKHMIRVNAFGINEKRKTKNNVQNKKYSKSKKKIS